MGFSIKSYLRRRHDPLTSLVLTVPVFLTYHLGILFIDLRNGVDLLTGATLRLLEQSVLAYVALTVGIGAGLAAAAWFMRKKGHIRPTRLLPVIGESTVLSILMLVTVGWMTSQVFVNQIGGHALGPLEKLVLASGAGFHEELVFRVALFAGPVAMLNGWRPGRETTHLVVLAVASSLVFSAVHYVGDLGDPFRLTSFTFRVLTGLFLCAVYRLRGFAVAVYTHTMYDLLVFFVL
jgi:hypothetical protein